MTPSGTGELDCDGLRRLLDAVPDGGTVLEVGSGPEWDADFLEAHGVEVQRADVADDHLGGPYDAVVALAVLQRVERSLMPPVLGRIAGALAPGGVFLVAIREGEGEQWEVGDSGNPSVTVLWLEPDFCDLLEDRGFELDWRAAGEDSEQGQWLMLTARRSG